MPAIAQLPTNGSLEILEKALADLQSILAKEQHLDENAAGREVLRLAGEMALYFEVIIVTRQVTDLMSNKRGWSTSTKFELAQRVATVRQALEVGVPLAKARVTEARSYIDDAHINIGG